MTWVGVTLLVVAVGLFVWPFVLPPYEDEHKMWTDDSGAALIWYGALIVGAIGLGVLVVDLML